MHRGVEQHDCMQTASDGAENAALTSEPKRSKRWSERYEAPLQSGALEAEAVCVDADDAVAVPVASGVGVGVAAALADTATCG